MPYGLKDKEIEALQNLFCSNKNVEQAVLYGSRAKGNYKPFSDIDITLIGDELTRVDLLRLCRAIDDLLMPYELDMNLYKDIHNLALLEHIGRVGIPLYKKGDTPSHFTTNQ